MNEPERFYIPLSPAEESAVRERVSKRIAQHYKETSEEFMTEDIRIALGLPEGRERLAFYRTTNQAWWNTIAQVNPNRARFLANDWRSLRRRYGPPPPMLDTFGMGPA